MQDVFASRLYSGIESRFYNDPRDDGHESIKFESITPKGVTLNGVIAESSIPYAFLHTYAILHTIQNAYMIYKISCAI
ncbi:MAG: hypothetical protein WAN47_06370 [Nitrosotalea sp.]